MKVVLFKLKKTSFLSWLIALVTRSTITHSAMLIDNNLYEATESRGQVINTRKLKDFGKRKIIVFDVQDPDLYGRVWATSQIGRKYDWKGVFGWMFKCEDRRKFYCFEYTYFTLIKCGYGLPHKKRVGGNDLMEKLFDKSLAIYSGRADEFV